MIFEREKIEGRILFIAERLCSSAEYYAIKSFLPFCGEDVLEAIAEQYNDALDSHVTKHRE
jgi:hypothetical protein